MKNWKELPIGGILITPGSAEELKTGAWRSQRPIWEKDKCTNCLICVIYCPDNAIMIDEDGKMIGINLDYCKGCGICAEECPKQAIHMEIEKK